MLEPRSRQLLLESLRPPPDFSLDRAVGTTFSLDLRALLMTPLAFALFDTGSGDGKPDPVALLEAVRRHAERIDVFCQAGQIGLPTGQYERVLAYLEGSVHEVVPDTPQRVFHPKVWVLRFLDADGAVRYRALCLSRNLTFARSWDTIVSLEGEAAPRRERNAKPLGDFVRALPELAPQAVPPERRTAMLELASQLDEAAFAAPVPFREVGFLPLGIKRHRRTRLPLGDRELRLVVSPFLSADLPRRFSGRAAVTLVSRPESLDALAPKLLDGFEPYTLAADAVEPVEDDTEISEATNEIAAERAGCSLRGLHAKLYLAEHGWDASLWTGSANATSAAFGGNVEFLVELRGPRAQCGLASVLYEDGMTFQTLLEPYIRGDAAATEPSPQALLEERLDAVRHALAAARFAATVSAAAEADTFALRLSVTADESVLQGVEARVWPISLADARARPLREALAGGADFGAVSFDRLTSFFAIELALAKEGSSAQTRFVVNAQLEGAPEDRGDLLLCRLLESREKVMRYLLLLLSSDGLAADGSGPVTRLLDALDSADGRQDVATMPLLESLVRALARDPHRLDHVERLVESLRRTEEGVALLPEGFGDIWTPLTEARTAAR